MSHICRISAAHGVPEPEALMAAPATSQPPRAAALAREWIVAHRNWIHAAEAPGAGNFDTPECLYWERMRDQAEAALEKAVVCSMEDAQALLQMMWLDSDAERVESPAVPRWGLLRLMEWGGVTPQIYARP